MYEAGETILPNDELVMLYNTDHRTSRFAPIKQWHDRLFRLLTLQEIQENPWLCGDSGQMCTDLFSWSAVHLGTAGPPDAAALAALRSRQLDSARFRDRSKLQFFPQIQLVNPAIPVFWRDAELHVTIERKSAYSKMPFFCAVVRSRHTWSGGGILGMHASLADTEQANVFASRYFGVFSMFGLLDDSNQLNPLWRTLQTEGMSSSKITKMQEYVKVNARAP